MVQSSYKYDSLVNNREQVKQDCQHILKNIDKYTGEILFFNHDIGTGKTTQFANIIPELAKDKRILILTYSYQVSSIWKDLIKDVENLSDSIYVAINPINELSECRMNRHDFKKLSIKEFYSKYCRKCSKEADIFSELYKNCLYDYENKIRTKQIVITSTGFFFEYQNLFKNFDVIIFDEILTLDEILQLPLSDMRERANKLSNDNSEKSKKALKVIKWLLVQLEAANTEFLNSKDIKKDVKPKIFEYDKDLFSDLLKSCPISEKQDYYFKIMSVFANSYPVWVYPIFKPEKIKKVEKPNNARYNKIEYIYHDIAFASKRIINIDNFDKTTVIVLSAVNTKAFIEQLFARKIKDENCFSEKVLNIYPNVISINYKRMPQKGKRVKAGLSNNDFINYKVKSRVREIVRLFATSQSESSKIAICGIKKVLKDKSIGKEDCELFKDDDINYTIIPFDKKVENQGNAQNRKIPALHFGISGLNDFADYRSFLLINNMFLPPGIHYMYCNNAISEGIDFSLSSYEFYINTNISQVRQLEGRLLRFTDDVKLKYIYRLNYYDHSHNYVDSEILSSDWLPMYSHPFMILKSYKNFKKYIEGGYKSSKDIWAIDRMVACINENFWYNLMEPDIAAEYTHKSKKLLFYVVKYLEYLIQEFENNKNDPNIEIPLDIVDCQPRTYQKWKLEIAEAIKYISLDHIDINTREISKQLMQQK